MKKILLLLFFNLLLIADSQELYSNCVGCHGENGETSAMGQSKVITGQESNLTIKQLTAYKNGELSQYGLGNIMQLQVSTLNEEDIQDLADYIATMQPTEASGK